MTRHKTSKASRIQVVGLTHYPYSSQEIVHEILENARFVSGHRFSHAGSVRRISVGFQPPRACTR
jgi:hypothetical protein